MVFFVGLVGSDDLHHMRFAMCWDRAPANHWETRLLANAVIAAAMQLFGRNQIAASLPSMLSSLTVLGCVLWWCHRYGTIVQAWWAAAMLVLLPIDVEGATSVSAYPLMVAFATVGTLGVLKAPRSNAALALCVGSMAAAVLAHLSAAYYVASLCTVFAMFGGQEYRRAACLAALSVPLALAIDSTAFGLLYGDPWLHFRLAAGQAALVDPVAPLLSAGRFNAQFFIWPIQQLLFSKQFGFSVVLVSVVAVGRRRRWSKELRLLLAVAALYWAWINFGTQVPWAYRPFYRVARFWQPVSLVLCVAFGAWVAGGSRGVRWIGATALAICLGNLLAGGSWGQSVRASGELLEYARRHSDRTFVTDVHTLNEMYVLNGATPPGNVFTTDDAPSWKPFDRTAKRLDDTGIGGCDGVLYNPLNAQRLPSFRARINAHLGIETHRFDLSHRAIAALFSPLREYPWFVRRPPSIVYSIDAPRAENGGVNGG